MVPIENILLKYIEQTAVKEEIQEVDQWLSLSTDNRKYFQDFSKVYFESNELKSYSEIDIDAEWNNFLAKKSKPLKPIEKSNSIRKIFYYAAAASVVGLLCFQFLLKSDTPLNLVESGNLIMTVNMPDNSQVTLYPNSNISYNENYNNLDERRIILDGKGKFNVVSNVDKPFIVVADDFETKVLGTIFTIEDTRKTKRIIVHEGSVSVTSNTNLTKSFVLEKGDAISYNENGFSEITTEQTPSKIAPAKKQTTDPNEATTGDFQDALPPPELAVASKKIAETEAAKENDDWNVSKVNLSKFTLKDVFSFLDKHHPDNDKFSKSRKCKPSKEDTISLDLQQDLESIIQKIEKEYDVEYDKSPCDGCFKIKSIKKK